MTITDDMLTEMEPIVAHWLRERGTCVYGASYAAALELAAYVAASRANPERDAVIEECAKVCERVAAERNIAEMRSGAELCVGAIRAMKTAPH